MEPSYAPPVREIPVLDPEAWESPWRLTHRDCGHGPSPVSRSEEEDGA